MPSSVLFVITVELILIFLTTLLLVQPFLKNTTSKARSYAKWGGIFLLGVTFCWSVVVGVVLSLNHLSVRF